REVLLFVKVEGGPWEIKDKAAPTQKGFRFTATQDGEYWFTSVAVDRSGNKTPADPDRQPPSLVVVVDTQPPEVELGAGPGSPGIPGVGGLVVCAVRDANPDPARVKVEYQRPDGTWRPLDALPNTPGAYRFPGGSYPEESEWTGKVRGSVADRAGNTATKVFDFPALVARASAPVDAAGAVTRVEIRSEKPAPPPERPVIYSGSAPPPERPIIYSGS